MNRSSVFTQSDSSLWLSGDGVPITDVPRGDAAVWFLTRDSMADEIPILTINK